KMSRLTQTAIGPKTVGFENIVQQALKINIYDGKDGLKDFAGLASQWLSDNCGFCGGADLNNDENVNYQDLQILLNNWLW
ncbi:MAG: hypothetical protein JEZ07_11865, partial [Phycisphaerae bacterium]|nr:hypothetical protein [Phycisphaerae bacterium]